MHLFLSYWNTQYWPVRTVYESTMIASSALDSQVTQERSLNYGRFTEYESIQRRTDSWALYWAMDRPNLRGAVTARKGGYVCSIARQTVKAVSKDQSLSYYVQSIVFEIRLTESVHSYRRCAYELWIAHFVLSVADAATIPLPLMDSNGYVIVDTYMMHSWTVSPIYGHSQGNLMFSKQRSLD